MIGFQRLSKTDGFRRTCLGRPPKRAITCSESTVLLVRALESKCLHFSLLTASGVVLMDTSGQIAASCSQCDKHSSGQRDTHPQKGRKDQQNRQKDVLHHAVPPPAYSNVIAQMQPTFATPPVLHGHQPCNTLSRPC